MSRPKMKLKKGDKVIVLTGKDKGKGGEIIKILTANRKALVSGVNMVKKHERASQAGPGGIQNKEMPVHISNLALEDPKDGKPTRVGYSIQKDGKKVRIAKRSGEVLDG